MNWTTLYITGKSDFKNDVRRKLEHSSVDFMPGYTGSAMSDQHEMYWISDTTDLRALKEAIGGKLIWKYRLRFYTSLEEFIESKSKPQRDGFTPDEMDMIHAMQGA